MKVRTKKRDSGNVLVIVTLSICMIVVPLSLVLIQIGMYLIDRDRAESTVEAACLVAANDLSRIVIDDPHFGYVSLSNYPPVGRGLRAPDGEPLPVVGINTLVGTVRQNTIIAHELGNESIGALVDDDREALDKTIKDLNFAWRCALSNRGRYRDIHGEEVILLDDVTDFIESHLPPNLHVRSIDLSQGWLVDEGGTTTISVPEPAMYARVNASDQRGGKYKPFRNIPLFNRPFSFAGAGASSSLVPLNQFQDADARHICSIVKIDCTIERDGPCRNFISASSDAFGILHCQACAQPYTMPDTGPRGILTLRFTGEPVP